MATTARGAETVWAAKLGQEDHVNGARGLLGWAGKESWEQGFRGCGGGPHSRGLHFTMVPGYLGVQQPFRLGDRRTLLEVR